MENNQNEQHKKSRENLRGFFCVPIISPHNFYKIFQKDIVYLTLCLKIIYIFAQNTEKYSWNIQQELCLTL